MAIVSRPPAPQIAVVRITTWGEYGLIVSLHLARRAGEGPIAARELAEREGLPHDYVEQILLRLRRADVVGSVRGARGGYVLARAAESVSIRDVVAASEGVTFEVNCVRHPVQNGRCAPEIPCSIRPVWNLLGQRIDEFLGGISLADLLHDEAHVYQLAAAGR